MQHTLPTLASQAEKVEMFRRLGKCQEPRLFISSDRGHGDGAILKSVALYGRAKLVEH